MPTENNTISVLDGDELDAALKQSLKESTATYVHRLGEPFTYEGNTWEKLTFHFGNLTGRDSLTIENEMALEGKTLIAAEFSGEFLVRMASRASAEKLHPKVLLALPLADYTKITGRARSFLLRSGR